MNQLTKMFDGQQLRIIDQNNEPWFVAKDVCEILELSNPSKAVSRLDDDERSNFKLGRQGEVNIVNEFGLYNLVLGSRKPEAKQFKRWITHEVIPSIRKTGSYEQPKSSAEMLLQQAELMVEYEKRINQAESNIAAAHHRIDNMDKIDTMGDKRQRLNKMIRLYASSHGVTFQQAWKNFRQSFNTAYRENLTMRIENYKLNHNLKKLSMPEYLERIDRLDDAIRVADKLLNQSDRGVM